MIQLYLNTSRRRLLFTCLLAVVFTSMVHTGGASPDEEWNKTYSDTGFAESLIRTSDGGYLLVGSSLDRSNWIIVKIDSNGNEQWKKTIINTGSNKIEYILPTSDEGYLVAGVTKANWNNDPKKDIKIIKIDSTGNILWNNTYGTDQSDDKCIISETSDGKYILVGIINANLYLSVTGHSDYYLAAIDPAGTELWNKTYEGSDTDKLYYILPTFDGGFILSGLRSSTIPRVNLLIKIDSTGHEQWNRTFERDQNELFQQTSDGGYIIRGYDSFIKTDPYGNKQYEYSLGGFFFVYVIQQTIDDGFIIMGKRRLSDDTFKNSYVVKIDLEGNEQWSRIFKNEIEDLQQNTDGKYIIAGDTWDGRGSSEFLVIKLKQGMPKALFTYKPEFPGVNQEISFDASSSYYLDGNITHYQWDFGDGTRINTVEPEITHSFTTSEDHTANLTIIENDRILNSTSCIIPIQKLIPPDKIWKKTFRESGNNRICSIQPASDSGYIIVGVIGAYNKSHDVYDSNILLIKTDHNGSEQWIRTLGNINENENGQFGQQTSDRGYIIVGTTYYSKKNGSPFTQHLLLVKTDFNGSQEWTRTFSNGSSDPCFVMETFDEGYVIVNTVTDSDHSEYSSYIQLIKTDFNGYELWSKKIYDDNDNALACSAWQTTDNGFIITGYRSIPGICNTDCLLIKTDSNGTQQWNRTFGGSDQDYAYSVRQTLEGGYIIAGMTMSYGAGDFDFWLIKTDKKGNEQWNNTFGGTGEDMAVSVWPSYDGGYVIAGSTEWRGPYTYKAQAQIKKTLIIKTDPNGNMQWHTGFGDGCEQIKSIQQTDDGDYILAGGYVCLKDDEIWMIKLGDTEPYKRLNETKWVLTSLIDNHIIKGTDITLTFTQDSFNGFTGCNYYGSKYTVKGGGTIAISEIESTVQDCIKPTGIMEQEALYLDVLQNVDTYTIEGNKLIISTKDGQVLVYQERHNADSPSETASSEDRCIPGFEILWTVFIISMLFLFKRL